jgi:phosphoglycolate phosphatase
MTESRAVLFDLDGTLVDTAPDLSRALNTQLQRHGRPPLDPRLIRPFVSHGSIGLLGFGFRVTEQDSGFAELRQEFLDIYQDTLCRASQLFPGMAAVLDELDNRRIRWGVVTNKPGYLTEPLLGALGLTARCCCIVSGDTLPQRKPDPAPMLYAAQQAGAAPRQCLAVGDAARDIESARRAGMRTLVASYGYIAEQEDTVAWGAEGSIAQPSELLDWLDA